VVIENEMSQSESTLHSECKRLHCTLLINDAWMLHRTGIQYTLLIKTI